MNLKIPLFLVTLLQIKMSLQDHVVQLPNGKIRGRKATTSENKQYHVFEKIPYAAPPVGDLRFQPPQPPKNWNDVLNTTNLDIACYQFDLHNIATESEDCLFLNVYTPRLPTNKKNDGFLPELSPVMVYIHGGGYIRGWSLLHPPDLFVNENIIYVSINYRLGIFGFLSTEDEVIPGNNGLKDQLFALKWVHDNIRSFGGDPNRVLIFGQSTGAGSVGHLLLNPKSQGLFQRAILQSGTFLAQNSLQRNPRNVAIDIASAINPSFKRNSNSQKILQFFKDINANELNSKVEEYGLKLLKPSGSMIDQTATWAPVIEVNHPHAFLTQKMYGLLKSGKILAVPTLMGFTSEECIGVFEDQNTLKETMTYVDQNLDRIVPIDMKINNKENRTRMGTKIRKIYTGGDIFVNHLASAVRYCSDNRVTRPMIKHAELFSKLAPTYFYQFSYDGKIGGSNVTAEGAESVGHSEDMEYLFCGGTNCTGGSKDDLITRKRLIRLWTNFAKYGNPTPSRLVLLQNIIWPKVSGDDDFLYLDINKNIEVKNHPKKSTYKEWTKLYESLGYDDFDTY